jgi:hypothetical protein
MYLEQKMNKVNGMFAFDTRKAVTGCPQGLTFRPPAETLSGVFRGLSEIGADRRAQPTTGIPP